MKKYFSLGFKTLVILAGLIASNSALAIVLPPSQGPNNAGSGANLNSSGTISWNNPSNIVSSNDLRATATITSSGAVTEYLKASNFSFSVPTGATIYGIQVGIEKSEGGLHSATIRDNTVRLLKNNVIVGNNLAATTTDWAISDTVTTYGDAFNLWGTTWTAADINNANFGVVLSANRTSGGDEIARVDHITITVFYTVDTTAPTSSITLPAEGSLVRGTINLSATATDTESGVAKVEFWHSSVVGIKISEDSTNPYSASLDTTTMSDGTHYIWADAYDNAGNHALSSSVSIVVDNTKPTLYLPDDISLEATNQSGEIVTYSVSASDVDPVEPTVSCVPSSGSTFVLGNTTVTCSATDTAGNTETNSFNVEIKDTTSPVISAPEDQTFEATGTMTTPTLDPATATDIADASPLITYSPHVFPLGTTEIIWTATDASGNIATTSSLVTINDTTGPVITLNGNNPFDMYINNDYATLNPDPDYTSVDAVDGTLETTVIGKDFDNTVLGSHLITYSATDLSGNNTTETRTVNIVDRNKPIIYINGSSHVTVERALSYEDAGAYAIDRDGTRSDVTGDLSGLDLSAIGDYKITYDFTGAELGDLTGTNVADQAKRFVKVIDTVAPTGTVVYSNTLPTTVSVTATLTTSEPVTITNNGGANTYVFTANGSFTFEFVDPSGNTGSSTAVVANIDNVNPIILSVRATATNTIEVIFDEALQNDSEGHHPSNFDFSVYNSNNDISYGISGVSYGDKKVTITLTNSLESGDLPKLVINGEATSLVDLAGNYYNDGMSDLKDVDDAIAPILSLIGMSPINLTVGDTYNEQGATSTDVFSGVEEPITISGTVDTNVAGVYTITYNVNDVASNTAVQISRTVNVNARQSSGGSGGGGGGGGASASVCANVAYGGWGTCVNGIQYRNVLTQYPVACYLNAAQQLERSRACVVENTSNNNPEPERQVLGERKFADGTLIKGSDNRIYVVLDGKLQYISSLKELRKYRGPVLRVDDSIILSFPKMAVLGVKKYADGTLLKARGDIKIYVIKNGKKVQIKTLIELKKYKGKIIIVEVSELANY